MIFSTKIKILIFSKKIKIFIFSRKFLNFHFFNFEILHESFIFRNFPGYAILQLCRLGTKNKSLEGLKLFLQKTTERLDLTNIDRQTPDRTTVLLKRQTIEEFFDIFTKKKRKKCPICHQQQEEVKFEAGGETKVYLEIPVSKTDVILDDDNTGDEEDEEIENKDAVF